MIVFEDGKPKNSDYRRFRIKTVKGADDYNSMREILTRRFEHGLKGSKEIQDRNIKFSSGKFSNFPRPYNDGWWKRSSKCSFTGF